MDKNEIEELRTGKVQDITAKLPDMDREDLVELQAQETAAQKPRETLISAVSEAIAAIDDADLDIEDDDAPAEKHEPKTAPITKDHYQHPAYAGPLTGDQAAWRNAHLKRADLHGERKTK